MQITEQIIDYLQKLSRSIPIELFTFLGAFLEEIIAPIPSPLVMTTAGSIAQSQGKAIIYLFVLSFIGAVGKTLGSWILYIVSDKAEDFILTKFGSLIGVRHKEVEEIGKKFTGGVRDWVVLFVLRAIPAIPTSPVSVVAGIIKLHLYTYLSATFVGTFVRNMVFLYLGYAGLSTAESFFSGFDVWANAGKMVVLVIIAVGIGYMYLRRKRSDK